LADNNNNNNKKKYGSVEDIFILCKTCHCYATYFDKSRLPREKYPMCLNSQISSFPILPNEAFTFNYNDKHGVELEFKHRKKGRMR
jgi:hypothetical protein